MATIATVINSLLTSKCAQNIEKMHVKLPSNDKFCPFESLNEKDIRNLVSEFGTEINGVRRSAAGCDPNYYELKLPASDPSIIATLRVEEDGMVSKLITNANKQYAVDIYSINGHLKNSGNNGIIYEYKENANGDLIRISEKQRNKTTYSLFKDNDGNIVVSDKVE